MTRYKILYWQEVPTQVKAEDDDLDEINISLPPRFLERIDVLAAKRGLQKSDDYLAQWHWSDEQERDGPAGQVALAVCQELEREFLP
jgi:hypothetical protein